MESVKQQSQKKRRDVKLRDEGQEEEFTKELRIKQEIKRADETLSNDCDELLYDSVEITDGCCS